MSEARTPFHLVELPAGEHLFCACGRSKDKPFCDGSHGNTGISPWRTFLPTARSLKVCGCTKTGIGPFCDNSHLPNRGAKPLAAAESPAPAPSASPEPGAQEG